jgi:hypothetical protein
MHADADEDHPPRRVPEAVGAEAESRNKPTPVGPDGRQEPWSDAVGEPADVGRKYQGGEGMGVIGRTACSSL